MYERVEILASDNVDVSHYLVWFKGNVCSNRDVKFGSFCILKTDSKTLREENVLNPKLESMNPSSSPNT